MSEGRGLFREVFSLQRGLGGISGVSESECGLFDVLGASAVTRFDEFRRTLWLLSVQSGVPEQLAGFVVEIFRWSACCNLGCELGFDNDVVAELLGIVQTLR